MATPRKSDEKYRGYLEDQDRKPFFEPTPREEKLLFRTVHPEEFVEAIKKIDARLESLENRMETHDVRFNEAMQMMFVQLANSSFLTLKIVEAEK